MVITAGEQPKNTPVKLAPPGAGIPFIERIITRFIILPFYAAKMDWYQTDQLFISEARKIKKLFAGIPPEKRQEPVLVPKQRGLEDSSRFWSATMVLEHLIIVGEGISRIMTSLLRGEHPQERADIAAVKPKGRQSQSVIALEFQKFVDDQRNTLGSQGSKSAAKLRAPHPWFGNMTASQWHWLMAAHMRVHRQQLEVIAAKLAHIEPS